MYTSQDLILIADGDFDLLDELASRWDKEYSVVTAFSGFEGLQLIQSNERVAVVVAGPKLFGMDQVEFLTRVQELSPNTVGIVLTNSRDADFTGAKDTPSGIVNFLPESCPLEILDNTMRVAFRQYITASAKDQAREDCLLGSVTALASMLGLANPTALARTARVKRYVKGLARLMGSSQSPLDPNWNSPKSSKQKFTDFQTCSLAVVLSLVGCATLPDISLTEERQIGTGSIPDDSVLQSHPTLGQYVVSQIPSLEEVAEIIAYQEKHFDGSGYPLDTRRGNEIPFGSRILKVALDFDLLITTGHRPESALCMMRERGGWYDPCVLDVMSKLLGLQDEFLPWTEDSFYSHRTSNTDSSRKDDSDHGCFLMPIGRYLYRPVMNLDRRSN